MYLHNRCPISPSVESRSLLFGPLHHTSNTYTRKRCGTKHSDGEYAANPDFVMKSLLLRVVCVSLQLHRCCAIMQHCMLSCTALHCTCIVPSLACLLSLLPFAVITVNLSHTHNSVTHSCTVTHTLQLSHCCRLHDTLHTACCHRTLRAAVTAVSISKQ